ncbi:MAG: MFS transporter [Solirubrobacterales bacterium]|nr:MFS transporter [Solirubrobacterales bacterium]
MKRVLRLAAYRRLLAAYVLNELAWAVGTLALAVLVYRRTGSAAGTAAFFLSSQFFPALVSPALVARLDQRLPRSVLPALYGAEAILFLALAWVAGRFSLAPLLALVVIDGIIAVTARALARAASVAVITPAGLLREGNALTNICFAICFMGGPALGGVVVATGGTSAALLANSGLFALIALNLVSARGLPSVSPERTPARGRLRAAIRHVRSDSPLLALLIVYGVTFVVFTISIPVEVVLAQHSLHAGAGGYGALLSGWGAGAVAGSAVYARWRGRSARSLISLSTVVIGIGFLVMAVAPTLAVAVAGAVAGGGGNGVLSMASQTAVQERTPERWMALVVSLSESIAQAAPGGGILLGGAIAALAGPRVALGTAGAGGLAIAVLAWIVLRAAPAKLAPSRARPRIPEASSWSRRPAIPPRKTLA